MANCKSVNCINAVSLGEDFCLDCITRANFINRAVLGTESENMALKYPKYYKSVDDLTEVDVYAIHHLFDIQDPSGAIQHASKKLLLSGVRTGGKSAYKDIMEAKDTLIRWLQINEPK